MWENNLLHNIKGVQTENCHIQKKTKKCCRFIKLKLLLSLMKNIFIQLCIKKYFDTTIKLHSIDPLNRLYYKKRASS